MLKSKLYVILILKDKDQGCMYNAQCWKGQCENVLHFMNKEEHIEHYKAFPDVIFFNLAKILNKVSLFFITKGTFESKILLCKNVFHHTNCQKKVY